MKSLKINKTFRAFIGIPISPAIQNKIRSLIHPLKQIDELKKLRWQKSENWHITLLFLGALDKEKYKKLITEIKPIMRNFNPFLLRFSTLKLFPNTKKPIALVLQPKQDIELKNLAEKLNKAAKKVGFEIEKRSFKPHLTIAKIDRNVKPKFITPIPTDDLQFTVDHFHLYKSEPSEAGSKYTIMVDF